jgi:energy-converting hydrogenase Eha subunit H
LVLKKFKGKKMKARKVNKGLSKMKKVAGYVSTIATVGIVITKLIKKKKKNNES